MIKVVLIVFVVIIVLIVSSVIVGSITFNKKIKNEVEQIFRESKETKKELVMEEKIERLPEPVQRYLKYTLIIGKERIRTVRLKQGGYFRTKENQKWLPIKAKQYFNLDSVEFIWIGKVKFGPLLSIYAKDEFINCQGNLEVKLWGLAKVVDVKGYEIDQGEILRFLGEGIWSPSMFIKDYIQWQALDNNSARATINIKGISASAVFHFNERGQITRITAKRYREAEGRFELEDWEILIIEYKMFNGIFVPSKANVIWKLKTGDFCYDKIELIDIEYNYPLIY